jgi:hypothetical protein
MKSKPLMRVTAPKRVEQVFASRTQDNLAHNVSGAAQRGQHLGAMIRTVAQRANRNGTERPLNLKSRTVQVQQQLDDTPLSDERSATDKEEEISLHRSRDIGSSGTEMGDSRGREKAQDSSVDVHHKDNRGLPHVRLSKRVQQFVLAKPNLPTLNVEVIGGTQTNLQATSAVDTKQRFNFSSPIDNLSQYASAVVAAHEQSQALSQSQLQHNPSATALLITREFIASASAVTAGEVRLAEVSELLMSALPSKSAAQRELSSSERSRRVLLPLQMLMATLPRNHLQHSAALARLDSLARTLSSA